MNQRWLFGLGAVAGVAAGAAAVRSRARAAERAARARRLQGQPARHGRSIVILGGGFGGVNTACSLLAQLPPESGWTVTIVDRHNYFLFTPLLYHAASGLVDPSNILFPTRSLSRAPNFRFREASVLGVDMDRQVVHLDDGQLSYDYLVVALGSVTNFFGQDAALRHALTLKTSGDAVAIRNRVIDAFERADIAEDPEERRRCLTFVVVGGGATGVELVGSLRGLVYGTLAYQYPRISPDEVSLLLFEATGEILPGLDRDLARDALTRLRELGVDVRLETPVERVDADGLLAAGGRYIPTRTVVWAAGVRPAPLAGGLDAPKIRGGRLEVDEFLRLPGRENVFAIGDIAAVPDPESGKPLPPSAAVAVQEGRGAAESILASLDGRPPSPFRYQHRGELISLGRHEALADVMGIRLKGFPAWVLWRAFYLSQLVGFRNQLSVAMDWSFAYFYERETVRLNLPCGRDVEGLPDGRIDGAAAAGPQPDSVRDPVGAAP